MKFKVAGIVFLVGSLYYIFAEAISATFFNASIINTYIIHPISELGIPNVNSPLFWLMNSAFIFIGFALIFGYFYKFQEFIIISILALVTGLGVIIVGMIHGGNPLTSGYHTLGAAMAILGGNVMLVLISKSMREFKGYQKATLILGSFGLISFWIMFFTMKISFMPVFERLSVYTLIMWSFLSGVFLLRNEN